MSTRSSSRRSDPDTLPAARLLRLARGDAPRVLDLFCGAGGLSLGFERAGFAILGGVDNDSEALDTFRANFGAARAIRADLARMRLAELWRALGHPASDPAPVDVLIGAPPCQAYAVIGRAKLRALRGRYDAHLADPRGQLYRRMVALALVLRPLAVVMENVPDLLNFGGRNIADLICRRLDRAGYACRYTVADAALFGVPQHRVRVLLVAVLRSLAVPPPLPRPTHRADTPAGTASLLRRVSRWASCSPYYAPTTAPVSGPRAIGVREALADLPRLDWHLRRTATVADRDPFQALPYASPPVGAYSAAMRRWPGHAASWRGPDGHVFRQTPRDFGLFARMAPGDEYPDAVRLAQAACAENPKCGFRVPPYPPDRFPNRWWKLVPERPARTLTAHLGHDSYTHIHWDSGQARTITVREAARLQSFPDGFRFPVPMNAAFRQIGNAVPPLMAYAIAWALHKALRTAMGAAIHSPRPD